MRTIVGWIALLRFQGELPFQTVAARLGTPEVTARTRVQRALDRMRAHLGSLRAIFVVPGAQAAVLGLAVVVTQLPAAPSPLAIAMADDTAAVQRLRHPRPVRHIAAAPKAPVVANPTPAAKAEPAREDATEVAAVKVFNFEDDELFGEVKGPDGEIYRALPRIEHSSLIEIRQHFVPEMVKSLEDF